MKKQSNENPENGSSKDPQKVSANTGQSTEHKRSGLIKRIVIALGAALIILPVLFVWAHNELDFAKSETTISADDSDEAAVIDEAGESQPPELQPEPDEDLPSEHDLLNDAPDEENEEDIEEEPEPEYVGVAYLTFDDGPSRTVTPGILDVLAQEEIKATFFILPKEGHDDTIQRMIDEGHEVGNHSNSHDYKKLYDQSMDFFIADVLKAHHFMLDNFGYTMTSFRFPGGSSSCGSSRLGVRNDFLTEHGYTPFDWDIDSGDAYSKQKDKSAENLTRIVLNNTDGREHVIILMHDHRWRESTLEALPMIIEGLREQGYTFDVMSNHPDSLATGSSEKTDH